MKQLILISSIALFLFSCGEKSQSIEEIVASNDLTALRQTKGDLNNKQQEIAEQLKQINAKINELDSSENVALVTTFVAKHSEFRHFVDLQGNVKTDENILIYPEFSGVMTNVYVTKGQRVSKGTALAKIDDGGLSQQVSQLQIQSDLAKTSFERQKRLWDQNIGSEIQFLQAKAAYESQTEAVSQLKKQIDKTVVRAPFSGTIDDVITDQGTVVASGQTPLFRIINLDNMYVEADVPEVYVASVSKGKTVKVEFPVLGISVDAKVEEASNYINPANRTFKVEVAIPNSEKRIKPNLTAKLKINDYVNEKALLIPLNIISENASGEQYVYVAVDQAEGFATAKRVIIETGKTQGDYIEVLSGIDDNDEIVQEGARSVSDAQKIKIAKAETRTAEVAKTGSK